MALTWRNVDAPDFSASLNGIRTFSDLFQGAIGSAERGIGQFDAAQDKRANNSFSMDLLKYQDPAAYKAALASGAVFDNVDPRRLSAASIQAAGNREGDLLTQSMNEGALDDASYLRTRGRGFDKAKDAAAPLIAQYLATSDPAARAAMEASGFGAGLSYADRAGLAKDRQAYEATDVGITGSRLGNDGTVIRNEDARFSLDNAKLDRTESRSAAGMISQIIGSSENAADAEQFFQTPEFKALSGPVQMAVRNGASALLGSAVSGGGSGGGGGSIGGLGGGTNSDPYNTVLGFGQFGKPSKPISDMTGSEAIAFGRDVLIPNTRNNAQLGLAGTGKGSSAIGGYQFTGETLNQYMPTVLKDQGGVNAKLTPENQDKIAEAIFNDRKNGNLKSTWTSLPNGETGAYKNVPWAKMKELIVRGETGADITALRQESRANGLDLADTTSRRIPQQRTGMQYAELADKTGSIDEVVNSVIGKGGAFAGTNKGAMTKIIRRIANEANVNFETAAAMATNSQTNQDYGTFDILKRRLTGRGTPNLGNGVRIDDELLNQEIAKGKGGKLTGESLAATNEMEARAGLNAATQAVQAAQQNLIRRRSSGKPLNLSRDIMALEQAKAAQAAAQAQVQSMIKPRPIAPGMATAWGQAVRGRSIRPGDGSLLRTR